MKANLRKWTALLIGIFLYYIIHEGAHLLVALGYGVFEKVRFMGVGMQIVIREEGMNDFQLGIFCLAGVMATSIVGHLFAWQAKTICKKEHDFLRAIGYYTTMIFLLLDPIYLSLLYRFVGGGDMNGILLFGVPEGMVQLLFGCIGVLHGFYFLKKISPQYRRAFLREIREIII